MGSPGSGITSILHRPRQGDWQRTARIELGLHPFNHDLTVTERMDKRRWKTSSTTSSTSDRDGWEREAPVRRVIPVGDGDPTTNTYDANSNHIPVFWQSPLATVLTSMIPRICLGHLYLSPEIVAT